MTGWDHRQYGTESDPFRQSDLNQLTSSFGCGRRMQFNKEADANEDKRKTERAFGGRVIGTATHGVIARVLWSAPDKILRGGRMKEPTLRSALREEIDVAAEGLPIEWGKKKEKAELDAAFEMIRGALETLPEYAKSIELVEAPFTVEVPSKMRKKAHGRGTIDLVFRGHDDALWFSDWKTGAQRADQITLDHGYQVAMYSTALQFGKFEDPRLSSPIEHVRIAGIEAAKKRGGALGSFAFGERPAGAYIVHLRDFVGYSRKGKRKLSALDEGWRGMSAGDVYAYEKGDPRGRGWYASRRTPIDDARFALSVSTVVGTVRLGRFVEMIGEGCRRCPYKGPCLTDGAGFAADEMKEVNAALGDDLEDGLL